MMHNPYRDQLEGGLFVPTIEVTKREDNGHFTATAAGHSITRVDQAAAVNDLSTILREKFENGDLNPGT